MYSTFTETFRRNLDKHAPQKTKRVRGNQRPFMTKELRNVVMNQSKTRNKYIKLALDTQVGIWQMLPKCRRMQG